MRAEEPKGERMSSQCNRFVQNAWKKDLCSNCFKSREEHLETLENSKFLNGKSTAATTKLANGNAKPQSILKGKTSSRRKKNVGFPDALTEVIGYGGDDFDDSEEFELSDSIGIEDSSVDTEEERALCNLTRSNTNFNTITANLSGNNAADGKKSFASLMLGKPRKDSDGKKKPLLVSVTPFGRDEVVSSAKRPSEKKSSSSGSSSSSSSSSSSFGANFHTAFGSLSKGAAECVASEAKSEVTLKSVHQLSDDGKPHCREKESTTSVAENGLEKIVDMPLITSSNLIAVIQKSDALSLENSGRASNESYQKSSDGDKKSASDRKIGISRSAAVKKAKDTEKPKISVQGSYKQTVNHLQEEVARTTTTTKPNESPREGEKAAKNWKNDAILDHESATFSADVISRELAGEPDGKADEDTNVEPPALPRSPPPVDSRLKHVSVTEPRNSFLHNAEKKTKPAIPIKPTTLPPKTPAAPKIGSTKGQDNASSRADEEISGLRYKELPVSPRVFHDEPPMQEATRRIEGQRPQDTPRVDAEASLEEEDDDGESFAHLQSEGDPDSARSASKRRMAPKPPPTSSYVAMDETSVSIFARNPGLANAKSDAPVVREKEKRERASSCSPKFRKDAVDSENSDSTVSIAASSGTEAPPRRGISLSQDSLANADKIEEHKKKGRSRFSLKKFLRMGSKKDQVDGLPRGAARNDDVPVSAPPALSPKPRLEIIHPLELDGAAVEVVSRDSASRLTDEPKTSESSDADKSQHPTSPSSPTANSTFHHAFARPGKPPPPPRNQSLDDWARLDPANKPARPPPPRAEIKASPKSWQPPPSPTTQSDSIYANLAAEDVPGEIRSGLAPSKPQRTASMRDQALSQPPVKKRPTTISSRHHRDYEALDVSRSPVADSPISNDGHSYECLSSSPECDSSLDLRRVNVIREFQSNGKRKSDSSILDPTNDFKYNQSFARSTSLPYCGSETESELYAPHSFYTGDEGPEEDQDWKSNREQDSGVGRLRRRRGRSIVHRSLEDNYGAVVVSNHEALAQVLEQLNQATTIPPALRGLKTRELHLADFSVDRNTCVTIGGRGFYSASWNDSSVTICISQDHSPRVAKKEFSLVPIVEFTDSVPAALVEQMRTKRREKDLEATIWVLPHLQICTIESFVKSFKDTNEEGFAREASFVLLQLVNALRSLQSRGIETVSRDLVHVMLCREDKDSCFRLYLLQRLPTDDFSSENNDKITLCRWVAVALKELLLSDRLTVVPELLSRERAVTLSQVKSVLEFSLWGPADVTLGVPREREVTLQRWLDLERATVLHALVKERAPLTVTDEYHLLFLVRTSAQIMCEASMLLESQRKKLKD